MTSKQRISARVSINGIKLMIMAAAGTSPEVSAPMGLGADSSTPGLRQTPLESVKGAGRGGQHAIQMSAKSLERTTPRSKYTPASTSNGAHRSGNPQSEDLWSKAATCCNNMNRSQGIGLKCSAS